MYMTSPYPTPPPLPDVNAHYIFFKRPDQAEWPNYTVHIDPATDARVMYNDHVRNIEDLSTGLAAPVSEGGLGLEGWQAGIGADEVAKPGETGKEIVGIISENSSEYITLVHACLRIAVPFALISSYSTPFELKHALALSKATRLFVDAKFLKTVLPAAKQAGIPQDRIYLMKDVAGKSKSKSTKVKSKQSFWGIIDHVRAKKIPVVDIRPASEGTLAYLVFSSGTSGLPKAVMISHGNLIYSVAQAMVVQQCITAVHSPLVPANPEGIPVTLAFLPLHHTYGLHAYCFRAALAPGTLIILPQWNIDVALKAIPKYKISNLPLIPSVVHQLVHHPGIGKVDFSSVQTLNSGAAYLPPELGDKLSNLVPGEKYFTVGYGMSEATIAAIVQPLDGLMGGKLRWIRGSTGVLLPGMEAVLLKDDTSIPSGSGKDNGDAGSKINEAGELWLRSKNIALGYWNNPKANRETFINGWLKTGDRFRVDEDGYFWYADRAKDTLKVSGAQVSPVEIEDCLLAHPLKLITDASVAGVSGGRTIDEKVPRAWVVLSEVGASKEWGKAKVILELEKWHQENLSKYKWLRGGIEVVDSIPKSPTGKTLRRVLQDRYEAHIKKHGRKAQSKL